MTNIIVLLGAPGCGKGTQSKHILHNYQFGYLSLGDALRAKKDLNLEAKLGTGNLIDSKYVNNVLTEEIAKLQNHIILLDGYPRKLDQALYLEGKYNIFIINFEIDHRLLKNRIENRYICLDCKEQACMKEGICINCKSTNIIKRADDNEEILLKRLKEYQENTLDVVSYYKNTLNKERFFAIYADQGDPEEIYNNQTLPIILSVLKSI